jgi:hypothetical protein
MRRLYFISKVYICDTKKEYARIITPSFLLALCRSNLDDLDHHPRFHEHEKI